jgi:3-oxoadipate enol-lactonase
MRKYPGWNDSISRFSGHGETPTLHPEETPSQAGGAAPSRPASRSEGVATARDGTRLAYTLHSREAAKSRVALVHSLAMDRTFWDPVAEQLDASVLVYDCRGHGASEKPAGPYTVELFAHDLADVLDHVGWRSALVAGASMGGCITLAFAAAYPARTEAVGLIDTTAWYGADAPKAWAERAEKALETGLGSLVGFQTTRWFGDSFRTQHPEVVKHCVDVFLRNDVKAYAETCKMLGGCDLRAALPAMRMPAAIVVGEEDYATPIAMAQTLQGGIANASMRILPGARHLTPLEQPQTIAAELSRLLQPGAVR